MKMHVFFDSGGYALKHALKENEKKENVFVFFEDLMYGPVGDLSDGTFQAQRKEWWDQINSDSDPKRVFPVLEEYQNLNNWLVGLNGKEELVFWITESAHELTCLMSFLAFLSKQHPISILNVSKEYKKANVRLKPRTVGYLSPEQLFNLLHMEKPLSEKNREVFESNWNRLINENGLLRVYQDKQVVTVSDNYFDEDIIKRASKITKERMYQKDNGFFPEVRLVGEVIGHAKQGVNDSLIKWRISTLVKNGVFEIKDDPEYKGLFRIKPV